MSNTKDALGDRMKDSYERRARHFFPRRTYTLIRVDGKAFHSFTRHYKRPFDERLISMMDQTACAMCENIMGAQFAYVQSDEISILLTDFGTSQTEAWFDGNQSKIESISAALATSEFNKARLICNLGTILQEPQVNTSALAKSLEVDKPAMFDSRAWTISDPIEVENTFIWRQQDATRNAVQMIAQANFSHRELQGLSCDELQEKLWQEKKINFNDFPAGQKRGRFVERITTTEDVEYIDRRTGENRVASGVARSSWVIVDPPIFTQDREFLRSRIPLLGHK